MVLRGCVGSLNSLGKATNVSWYPENQFRFANLHRSGHRGLSKTVGALEA